jgi:uncharacterized protein YqhQ
VPKAPQALVGGQAVIEGVMMRAPGGVACAVRRPDGSIAVRYDARVPFVKRFAPFRLPILRGAVTLVEALILGTSTLLWSAEEAAKEEERRETKAWEKAAFAGVTVLSFAVGLFLFFWVPLWLTDLTGVQNGVVYNLVDGVFRLAIFFAYMVTITRWGEMRRVFQYHGAEHMAIFNYEAEVPISVENTRGRPRLHPRCGTSFLFFVMLVSIFVFALLGKPETLGDRFLRIAFVPVIGGLSYEVIRFAARIEGSWIGRMLSAPGKGLQLLTTAVPDDTQIEVAVASLKAALTGDPAAHEPDAELAAQAAAVLGGEPAESGVAA